MKVYLAENVSTEKISIKSEEGQMIVEKKVIELQKGDIENVIEVTNFDEYNKNIRLSDNSTLTKIPNDKMVISGDRVKPNSGKKKSGGCGGCARKRKQMLERERRASNGS